MKAREQLKKLVEKQLEIEKNSIKEYTEFLKVLGEEESEIVSHVIEEERQHVQIVMEMKELLKEYEGFFKGESLQWKSFSASDLSSAMLLVSSVEDYIYKVITFLKSVSKFRNVVYVSYNKVPEMMKKELDDEEVDTSNIEFVTCSKWSDEFIDPSNLEAVSSRIAEKTVSMENVLVVVDNITAFTSYHGNKDITDFVSNNNQLVQQNGNEILWIAVDQPSKKQLVEQVSALCEKQISI